MKRMLQILAVILTVCLTCADGQAQVTKSEGLAELCNKGKSFYPASSWGYHSVTVEKVCELPEDARIIKFYYHSAARNGEPYYGCKLNSSGASSGSFNVWGYASDGSAVFYDVGNCEDPDPEDPDPEPDPCKKYQDLFDPPATDCNFSFAKSIECITGDGQISYTTYKIKDSQGRTADYVVTNEDVSADVHCDPALHPCNMGDDCFTPFDPNAESSGGSSGGGGGPGGGSSGGGTGGGTSGVDPDKCYKEQWVNGEKVNVNICNGSGEPYDGTGESGWGDKCVYWDEIGMMRIRPECQTTGNGSGGGDGDGTYGGQLNSIIRQLKGLTDAVNGISDGLGNGSGSGSGQDYSGHLDGLGGKLDGVGEKVDGVGEKIDGLKDSLVGDGTGGYEGDGGFGEIGNAEGMDKGKEDLTKLVDDLLKKLDDNSTIKAIKGHKYIDAHSPACKTEFAVMGQAVPLNFCNYEGPLRTFGNILFGLMTLIGFFHVLRSV